MFKYTKTTLKKIEEIFKTQGYTVRYEKGSFTSGYCLVEERKIAIINRFYDTEGRINTLLDILSTATDINEELFEEKEQKFYNQLMKSSAKKEDEREETPVQKGASITLEDVISNED